MLQKGFKTLHSFLAHYRPASLDLCVLLETASKNATECNTYMVHISPAEGLRVTGIQVGEMRVRRNFPNAAMFAAMEMFLCHHPSICADGEFMFRAAVEYIRDTLPEFLVTECDGGTPAPKVSADERKTAARKLRELLRQAPGRVKN